MDLFYILKYGTNSQCVFLCFSDQLLGRKHLVWSQLKRTELTGRWQWKSELPENQTNDRWHRTTLFWEKHMKHPPHPLFFLNQHQIILPCSTFKISILYCEEQMLYGDERLHYLHRWDYCCLCMTSAHFFVITNEFVLLVKVCSRWGHVIYFCTVT